MRLRCARRVPFAANPQADQIGPDRDFVAELGPARASVVAYIAPGFSVFYGATLLGERLTLAGIAGLLLIIAGSWLGAQGGLPRRLSRSGPSHSSAPEPARAR